jgi:large subunit ribosomal protein L4
MAKITIYNQQGKKLKDYDAPAEIFDVAFNNDLIQQALIRQLANRRVAPIAHTKTKGEVVGGKKKPFRQKGTGNARQGATNNPHQIGGGVSFGPRNARNYKQMMPKKQRRHALFSALSQKLREEKIFGLDAYEQAEIKTKTLADVIKSLPVDKDLLIVLPGKNEVLTKSANNLPLVKTITVQYLNIADLQKYDKVVFLEEALSKIEEVFSTKKSK